MTNLFVMISQIDHLSSSLFLVTIVVFLLWFFYVKLSNGGFLPLKLVALIAATGSVNEFKFLAYCPNMYDGLLF